MRQSRFIAMALGAALAGTTGLAQVDSGSICASNPADPDCLGDVTYSIDTEVPLPPDGKLQFGSLTVAAGVTVTFTPNALNTPVFILCSGDVLLPGTLSVSAPNAATPGGAPHTGVFGDGNYGDDGVPGNPGPGGFRGGAGGLGVQAGGASGVAGEVGIGPGGGNPGSSAGGNRYRGAGGGYGGTGISCGGNATGGPVYGQASLQPLNGGSGGGGGGAGSTFNGAGAGGGGGAILLASGGTITINNTGRIFADGGTGGQSGDRLDAVYVGHGGSGGGGSGGAIRVVGTTIAGTGLLLARGGAGGAVVGFTSGCAGASGRIRMEAETFTYTGTTTPTRSFDAPGPILTPNNPTLAITGVGGEVVPAAPTGAADVTLPEAVAQPVTVTVTASEIPLGTTVDITVKPPDGQRTTVTSTALSGTLASSTASAALTLPPGPSTLEAQASFTLVLGGGGGGSASIDYEGEKVLRAEVSTDTNGRTGVVYITESGKRVPEAKVGPLAYATKYAEGAP